MSRKTSILSVLLMTIFFTVQGQTDKKAIQDAWVYLDSWKNYQANDTLDLVKSWSTPTICVVSFEKGLYSTSDEHGKPQEKGRWNIKRIDGQDLIIIKIDNGQIIKFEILWADRKNLKLRRVK